MTKPAPTDASAGPLGLPSTLQGTLCSIQSLGVNLRPLKLSSHRAQHLKQIYMIQTEGISLVFQSVRLHAPN